MKRTCQALLVGGAVSALLGLGGCTDSRSSALASVQGTWIQVMAVSADQSRITDPARAGFITIGTEQVVVALAGYPKLISQPVETIIDPGTHSGRIMLADGVRLFLVTGETLVEQPSGPYEVGQRMVYLDLATTGLQHAGHAGGGADGTLRLWLERSLACPLVEQGPATQRVALATPAEASEPGAGDPPRAAAPGMGEQAAATPAVSLALSDQLACLAVPELADAGRALILAQSRGASAGTLASMSDDTRYALQRDVLARLEVAAAAPDARQAALMADIDQRLHALRAFSTVVSDWLIRL